MKGVATKLQLAGDRVIIAADDATDLVTQIFRCVGCRRETARMIAEHLADASLCGVESHGLMRTLQYVEQFETGTMRADAMPHVRITEHGVHEVDGGGGIGIPAMHLAVEYSCRTAKETGISALAIRHVGHTGRLGAFAEVVAETGCLIIMMGGGNRQKWRQVAPHGGRQAMLPTNPYCIGIPGGERGPVVLDFATSKIAGGWIYAARSAGARLPEGAVIDTEGRPTQDPEDYFRGGAILPAGGAKGYALSVVAELIGEAMLGPATTETNWLMITLDVQRYRESSAMQTVAEEILAELRGCPPAPGFDRVEVPGERERDQRVASNGKIAIPERTWKQICELADRLTPAGAD